MKKWIDGKGAAVGWHTWLNTGIIMLKAPGSSHCPYLQVGSLTSGEVGLQASLSVCLSLSFNFVLSFIYWVEVTRN